MSTFKFVLGEAFLDHILPDKLGKQAGDELCQAQGKIKLANFGTFCFICLVGFGAFVW